jgi:uncharacterized protein
MHDALAFATIYIGEGATMASEAGVLGTPSVYISSISISYILDQEKYGTVFNFHNYNEAIDKIDSLLVMPDREKVFAERKAALLQSKIDVTGFLVWFVENWPGSFTLMKEQPEAIQQNFMHTTK